MKFLKYANDSSPAVVKEMHDRYSLYLKTNKERMPEEAYDFAVADWHYDPTDHRWPHDSWVETFEIIERSLDEKSKERVIDARLVLLGSYQDGHLEIAYENVQSYSLTLLGTKMSKCKWHGDLLIDEVTLSDNDLVLHEIDFWLDGTWKIECENIRARWVPIDLG